MLSYFWSAPQGNAVATFARLLPFWSAPNAKQQAECQTTPAPILVRPKLQAAGRVPDNACSHSGPPQTPSSRQSARQRLLPFWSAPNSKQQAECQTAPAQTRMAALLESLLQKEVEAIKAVEWLKHDGDSDSLAWCKPLKIERQEFVPFLLNFLREQSCSALTHGPATPAKTPSHPRVSQPSQQGPGFSSERRGGCRSTGPGTGPRSASRVQLFSTPSLSPGAEWDTTHPPSGSHCLGGISALSSPSFSSARSPASASTSRHTPSERRSAQRASLGDFMLSPPELPHQPHPSLSLGVQQQTRGRRRSAGMGGQGRQGGGRGVFQTEEVGPGRSEGGGRKGRGGGANKMGDPAVSPPMAQMTTLVQLNLTNLEDFPPMGMSHASPPLHTKPSRRINPTPVSAERPHSRPKTCFTSTPFSTRPSSPPPVPEAVTGAIEGGITGALNVGSPPLSLQEERELLKRVKCKRAQQVGSPRPTSLDPCTPTKSGLRSISGSKMTPDTQGSCPDPSKVTLTSELDLLADLYCTCISENLVPNVFLELFFVLQLLTSRTPAVTEEEDKDLSMRKLDVLERGYLSKVHNCVYFSVRVLENQFELVSHLDKDTLRLLAENERVACFSPSLRNRLTLAQDASTAKVSPSVDTFIHSVPFQPATDNRSNFSSDKAFHTFKKQRDIFYEVLREWEDFHKEPRWEFEAALGSRVRGMVSQLNSTGNHSHFARLFLKQLVQMCKGPRALGSPGDTPDADLLGMLGADSLGRLKRLEERLIQPQGILGPCPPPAFPGHQEFFRDFLKTASCCQLNQHLKDSLCQQLLQLDEVSVLAPVVSTTEGEGDMEQQDEKQRFSSVLLLARLLAKFLGYISFLPYQTSERPSREIQEATATLRSKSMSVLDVCAVLRSCVRRRRTILTVPWLVEFLSMLDFTGPFLLCYRTVLGLLLGLYRRMVLSREGEVCYLNQLLMVAVLGWLFQIPVIPEELFFSTDFTVDVELEESQTNVQGLDCLPLVDQQLLYTCCPFLGEFRKLLAAFVAGSSARGGGLIRKITPTSAELRGTPIITRSQQKLQVDLEQAFFHNQPPSLRRTVEFVAERVGSNCVKHMKVTLVCELVRGGERLLREGLISPGANPLILNDSICAQLCDGGQEALERATRFCSEKGPEAIRVLLPDETSPAVLTTSENITKRLATEKACSWLSSNITALVKREWKTKFDRVMKSLPSPEASGMEGSGSGLGAKAGAVAVTQEQSRTPKRDMGKEEAGTSCPPDCPHSAPLPSDVLVEIKEVLSIAVGPRSEKEVLTCLQLNALLGKVGDALSCKKFSFPMPEQMLIRCTVLLACKLVSGELPVASPQEECGRTVSPGRTVSSGPVLPGSTVQRVGCSIKVLLEQLILLWGRDCCSSAPLHLLFTEMTLSAVLMASDSQWDNFLFLVRQLVERGILGEEEVVSHWRKLSQLPWPTEFIGKIQQQSSSTTSLPLPELQNHMDLFQVSPVEGAN
ncbi:codanin-1 [Salmo salar]|uniref:Codanin-1 n=1 Tax=Salmo salar TaxID=8030 RepID=A0A1S3RGG3_SALSA|nr:codanin-1 [Salmo salar]